MMHVLTLTGATDQSVVAKCELLWACIEEKGWSCLENIIRVRSRWIKDQRDV